MTIASGANIDISGGSLDSNGGNVTLQPGTNVFPSNSGVDVTTGAATTLGITSGKDLKILINGTTPDSGYTQLNVAGLVDVTGVNLNLAGSSLVPAGGESFTIVENDGADAVTGTFTGLGEGAMIANFLGSGLVATVTYAGRRRQRRRNIRRPAAVSAERYARRYRNGYGHKRAYRHQLRGNVLGVL